MEATGCRLSFVNFGFLKLIKYENYLFYSNNWIEKPLNFSENLDMF